MLLRCTLHTIIYIIFIALKKKKKKGRPESRCIPIAVWNNPLFLLVAPDSGYILVLRTHTHLFIYTHTYIILLLSLYRGTLIVCARQIDRIAHILSIYFYFSLFWGGVTHRRYRNMAGEHPPSLSLTRSLPACQFDLNIATNVRLSSSVMTPK